MQQAWRIFAKNAAVRCHAVRAAAASSSSASLLRVYAKQPCCAGQVKISTGVPWASSPRSSVAS
jgi:hypothetical protein